MPSKQDREERLNALFAAYRQELPDFEAGPAFMPGLWKKIEVGRSRASVWSLWSQRVVAGACCAGVVLVGLSMWGPVRQSAYYEASYVESVDDNEDVVVMAALHPASPLESPNE